MRVAVRIALAVIASSGLYTAALCLAPVAAPVVLLVPLPGLLLAAPRSLARWPLVAVGLWCCLTAGAISIALGADAAPGFVLALGLPAVVLAVGVSRRWAFERTALAGIVMWALGVSILAVLAYGDIAALLSAAREQLANGVALALSNSAQIGTSAGTVAALDAEREAVIDGLLQMLPALVILTGAVMVLVNLMVVRKSAGALPDANLRCWRAPDSLIWVLILAGFAMFVPAPAPALVARNAFAVLLGCYLCQGLAIVGYYLDRFRLPLGLRVVSYLLIAVQHVVAILVLVLGIFDLWGNFRRLNAGPADVRFHTDGK
jgi:hypothetical protein